MTERHLTKRRFHRFDSGLVSWFLMKSNKKKGAPQKPDAVVKTKNIAGGGIAFLIKKKLSVGDFLEMELQLPTTEVPVSATAKVMRIEELKDGLYDIGVCFTKISHTQQEKLLKYIDLMESKS